MKSQKPKSTRFGSTPVQVRPVVARPSPPPAVPRPSTRSLRLDKGSAVINARLNSSMLAWSDKRPIEEPRRQVSYYLHQNKLLERVVVNLKERTDLQKQREARKKQEAPTTSLQALESLIKWAQRYMLTVTPYVAQPDVSVSLARDSLQASLELAQSSLLVSSARLKSPAKSSVSEDTLQVRKKLLQYQAQKALQFLHPADKDRLSLLGTMTDSLGKAESVGCTPKALLDSELRKDLSKDQPFSVSQATEPPQDLSESYEVRLQDLAQQKAASDSLRAKLASQLEDIKEEKSRILREYERTRVETERLQMLLADMECRIQLQPRDSSAQMVLEDCLSHLLRLQSARQAESSDTSSLSHAGSKACSCVFTRSFPPDLLLELEAVLSSLRAQWRQQLDLEDKLRLQLTALEVENEGLRSYLKQDIGVKLGESGQFVYSPIPFASPMLTSPIEHADKPVPAALQEIADFEQRMRQKLAEKLDARAPKSDDEYDSSGPGRYEAPFSLNCSFGVEAASPVPPLPASALSTLREVHSLVFAADLKPGELQTALRSLLAQTCLDGQLSPPLSGLRSPEPLDLPTAAADGRKTDMMRNSLDSTGAPPSIRDAVLRILRATHSPQLLSSTSALRAFFQISESEIQQSSAI